MNVHMINLYTVHKNNDNELPVTGYNVQIFTVFPDGVKFVVNMAIDAEQYRTLQQVCSRVTRCDYGALFVNGVPAF